MPTYEYECLTNGHRFEVKQSFKDDAISVCEVCNEPVRKVFSAAGIVFKGSGYYVTDTRSGGKSSTSKAPTESSSGSSSSDAKPANSSTSSSTSTSTSSD